MGIPASVQPFLPLTIYQRELNNVRAHTSGNTHLDWRQRGSTPATAAG